MPQDPGPVSLKAILVANKEYIVDEIRLQLGRLPKSPVRELQIQTDKGRRRLERWLQKLIDSLGEKQDFFIIDSKRAAELLSIQALGLDFSFHYYNIFQKIIKNLLEKINVEELSKNLCVEVQELNIILLSGYNSVANFYIKVREDQIHKILDIQKTHNLSQKMLKNPLSKREIEVLESIGKGHSDQQIADSLFISVNTLRSHVKSIYRKLEVSSKAQAISKAVQLKIIEL